MYTLLYGAKKNVGDFLILDRAQKLLEKHKPDTKHLLVKRWLPIDEYIDEINKTKAIILCGGPAYQKKFYPGIYPLTERIKDIKVPIIPFGLGWFSEFAEQDPSAFHFSNSSHLMIERIHNSIPISSTRDDFTEEILHQSGFYNTMMTGCPAWYELDYIDEKFKEEKTIKNIVVTTAQNNLYHDQNVDLMRRVHEMFPNAEKHCVFHRGILSDAETSVSEEKDLLRLESHAKKNGYHVVDASYDVSNLDFYKNCDLHIGYRVHAHIYFLSIRKPSFLLHEDGRGRGFSTTLDIVNDVAAYEEGALEKLMVKVKAEYDNSFCSFLGLEKKFQVYYKNMEKFINSLP